MKKQKIRLNREQLEELKAFQEDAESAIELRRVQAIILVNSGILSDLIKELTGYGEKYAFDLRKKYLQKGIESLKQKKRKPRALLTEGQRKQVLKILIDSKPKEYGFESEYWTTSMLALLIKEQFGVHYKSKTSLYIIFKEAKFTYHKPDKQYKNRDQKLIDTWIENNKPKIKEALNDQNTVVLFSDEMMLSTQTTTQKIWLPQGQYPKIDVSSKRALRCIYGFLNIQNGHEYAFKTDGANSEATCDVFNKLVKIYPNKKIMIIWDNAPWHKSAKIKQYLTETKNSFHLVSLPPYAPELNPQEHVWKAGREAVTHNHFIDDIDQATDKFIEFLSNKSFDYGFLGLV